MPGGEGASHGLLYYVGQGEGRGAVILWMVKASPELSPMSLSFLGEETVLNSGGEVGAELGGG